MATRKRVAVIGAGVSGLVTAKAFHERGHEVTIFERGPGLGGVWEPSRSYPGVKTQSPKDLYRYTDMAMPKDYPEWPSGTLVHQYLSFYSDDHGLTSKARYNTSIEKMTRREDGKPGWTLRLNPGADTSITEDFDFVAVCTGLFSEKNVLVHEGQEEFQRGGGSVIHSSEYTGPEAVAGKRVVILGFGKSATDLAVNAVNAGAQSVSIVYRKPVWRMPYFIAGLINFKRVFYIRVIEGLFPVWDQGAIARVRHAVTKPFVWAIWRFLEFVVDKQLGLRKLGIRPEERIEDGINCSSTIATEGFHKMIADGRIRAVQGTFAGYQGENILLTGGQRLETDVVIQAVGWKLGVPFLEQSDQEKLVEPDGQFRLFRYIANPDLPDMGFVGFNSSFCSVLSAELAANWLVRYADGKLVRQPSRNQMKENIAVTLDWRRRGRPAAGDNGGLCIVPYQHKHFDELLRDMGATKRRLNPLAETLTPPRADAFARFIQSAPQYQAE